MNPLQSADVQFSESQGFGRFLYLTYVIGGVITIVLFSFLKITNKLPISWGILSLIFFIEFLVVLFMTAIKMEIVATKDTLYIRYIPIIPFFKTLSLEDISSIETVTYSALGDYGGWGIRGSKKDRCYNAQGNRGVRIKYSNGYKLLIGSQRPEELERALKMIVKSS